MMNSINSGKIVPMSSLREFDWRDEYRTSEIRSAGKETDILNDFYIPALVRSMRYDRFAGYFRSSSLAAASQGFTAFAKNNAKARFIVGCDLDVGDVKAVLEGADEVLIDYLTEVIENDGSWSIETVRGVDLFAYLISKGILEIKIAFRVHRRTGEPISFDVVEDGYVHEKWAVFVDGDGNSIRIDGSLNESKTALSINAENILLHCSWWDDRSQRKAKKALDDFSHLWKYGCDGIRVMDLPEAVRRRLIRMGENVMEPQEITRVSKDLLVINSKNLFLNLAPIDYLRWRIIKDGPLMQGGQFVGIETAPVEPWPHQSFVARRLVDAWPHSFLLCDEVGLGKTIEAGLAIRSLILSGMARRVLIASPASLTQQWHREMKSKFLLDFARTISGRRERHERLNNNGEKFFVTEGNLLEPDLIIASTGLLTHQNQSEKVKMAQGWDIVLVDEAHYMRVTHGQNRLYSLIKETVKPKSKSLLLATATPMQLEMREAFNLMELTGRVGSFGLDNDISRQYYETLRDLIFHDDRIPEMTLDFFRRAILEIKSLDLEYHTLIMNICRSPSEKRTVSRWIYENSRLSEQDYNLIARLIRAAAPLSRVMLRHTRKLLRLYQERGNLNVNLAERNVRPLDPIKFSSNERQIYNALETYCQKLDEKIRTSNTQDPRYRVSSVGFYLSFLRLRFASSLYAIRKTLGRRVKKINATLESHNQHNINLTNEDMNEFVFSESEEGDEVAVETILNGRIEPDLQWELNEINKIIKKIDELEIASSKLERLFRELDNRRIEGRIRQTVIFTRFKDTLDYIVEELRSRMPSILVGTFSGSGGRRYDPDTETMMSTTRTEIAQSFVNEDIDVLICTDAAAEGLNLQTADLLINFDLPWNPAKVEQRIGRIDRIGQKHEIVEVVNYAYAESAEEWVYSRLLSRLEEAGLIIGPQQISLLPVTESDFKILGNPNVSQDEIERIEGEATKRLTDAKAAEAALEISPNDMHDLYKSMEKSQRFPPPVTLSDIGIALSSLTKMVPSILSTTEYSNIYEMRIREEPVIHLTACRSIFQNPPNDVRDSLQFASYGGEAFDKIINMIPDIDAPWFRRISISNSSSDILLERVYFVVFTQDGCKEIFKCSDLVDVKINPCNAISEEEFQEKEDGFSVLYNEEIGSIKKKTEDLQENHRASKDQLFLSYEIGASYVESGNDSDGVTDLHSRLRDKSFDETPNGFIVRMQSDRLNLCAASLFKKPESDMGGPEINVHISLPQLKAAKAKIDSVIKEMRGEGKEISQEAVANRLRHKADQR